MIRKTLVSIALGSVLACPAAEPKTASTNPYVAEAADPQGFGTDALITKWVDACAATDHATIIAQRNVIGLATLDLLDGVASLVRSSSRVGDSSLVIDRLRGLVANPRRSERQRDVAAVCLIYVSQDAQSIELTLDHLATRSHEGGIDRAIADYLSDACVLTASQRARLPR